MHYHSSSISSVEQPWGAGVAKEFVERFRDLHERHPQVSQFSSAFMITLLTYWLASGGDSAEAHYDGYTIKKVIDDVSGLTFVEVIPAAEKVDSAGRFPNRRSYDSVRAEAIRTGGMRDGQADRSHPTGDVG